MYIKIGSQRLYHQRVIKQKQGIEVIREMTKSAVCEQKLQENVIIPEEQTEFKSWWSSLKDDDDVVVQFPHERHGLQGRTSNSAKTTILQDFLTFVDSNSTPNGRAADSHCATSYFLPKFRRINPPAPNEKNADEKSEVSLTCEFNRAQQSVGKGTVSKFSINNWLKTYRPKVAIHPHQTDYCDTCKRIELEIARARQIQKRLMQSGSASQVQIQQLLDEIDDKGAQLADHKKVASKAQEFYHYTIEKCQNDWKQIQELEGITATSRSSEQSDMLDRKKRAFTLVLSADYQQAKLIPYWGSSAQPGSTYYLQKVSHDVFGIINHAVDGKYIVLFDERIGPKNTDHTVSYLESYITRTTARYSWIKKVIIFLDNATSTNKNRYLFAWGTEVVEQKKLDYIRFCFMIAGHTKFAPDRLFAQVANSYNHSDVFTIPELQQICNLHAETVIDDGTAVLQWREATSMKYSDLPGTRKYHDFLIARSVTGSVVMKVQEKCFDGSFIMSPLNIIDESAAGSPTQNYKTTHTRALTDEKMKNMITMYDKFVDPDRRPSYLPPFASSSPASQQAAQASNSGLTTAQSAPSRKRSHCKTPGCDGSGHRNKSRWHEGHSTRAGCPRVQDN